MEFNSKKDLVGCWIKNDQGELRDKFVAVCNKFGIGLYSIATLDYPYLVVDSELDLIGLHNTRAMSKEITLVDFEATKEDFNPTEPICTKEKVKPLTEAVCSFNDTITASVLELNITVTIKQSDDGDGIYYEVYHPDHEDYFEVNTEEEFKELVNGFKTISKYKV